MSTPTSWSASRSSRSTPTSGPIAAVDLTGRRAFYGARWTRCSMARRAALREFRRAADDLRVRARRGREHARRGDRLAQCRRLAADSRAVRDRSPSHEPPIPTTECPNGRGAAPQLGVIELVSGERRGSASADECSRPGAAERAPRSSARAGERSAETRGRELLAEDGEDASCGRAGGEPARGARGADPRWR